MTNTNEENKDLIENRIPWELLDEKTKERLSGWKYGWEVWSHNVVPKGWVNANIGYIAYESPRSSRIYRAKPAPERRECFVNVYPQGVAQRDANWTGLSCEQLAIYKISFDEDGNNPTIEVIEEND